MEVSDPATLPQGNSPWYSMHSRLGVSECRYGHWREKNIFSLLEIEPRFIQYIV
jgi:hypothetical protein